MMFATDLLEPPRAPLALDWGGPVRRDCARGLHRLSAEAVAGERRRRCRRQPRGRGDAAGGDRHSRRFPGCRARPADGRSDAYPQARRHLRSRAADPVPHPLAYRTDVSKPATGRHSAQLSQRQVRIHGPVDPEGRCGHDCSDAPQPGVSPRTRRRWAASRVHSSHGRCT